MARNRKIKWLSIPLSEYAGELLSGKSLTNVQRHALQRFFASGLDDPKQAYYSLCDQYSQVRADQYLKEVFEFYLDAELFQPCRQIDHKDWLRKLIRESERAAATIGSPPSPSISVPPELSNAEALILAGLEDFGDEIAIAQFRKVDPYLKRALQKIPLTLLLDTIVQVAQRELVSPPTHYWENEYGITAPRKHGEDGAIAERQILIKGIKKITRKFFDAPHHDVVATLVNTLLETALDADSISKTPD